MRSGISLANKCQLLFGFAVVVILTAALSVPWVRTYGLVQDYQVEVARQVADAWLSGVIQIGSFEGLVSRPPQLGDDLEDDVDLATLRVQFIRIDQIEIADEEDRFLADALERFRADAKITEHFATYTEEEQSLYRYARAIRESQIRSIRDESVTGFTVSVLEEEVVNPLRALLIVDRTSQFAEGQLLTSRIYIIAAGLVGSLLAVLVFYLILTKLILHPVRKLRRTTDALQEGNLHVRSEINTGDEFQQLSEAFNAMLDRLDQGRQQLHSMNESLDLKVNELAETNVGLFESNRFKSEFLANVSHELRTPLNSIIGFAELLEERFHGEVEPDPKRLRYINNILSSSRSLLEMINELLDLAKIEAGRMEVSIESTSVTDLIEGLMGIMTPQAATKQIELTSQLGVNVPMIETDPGKLQQILYNFLSNAIKFTPDSGSVSISAARVTRQDNTLGVRIAVTDTGPGIPADMQDVIFEKFRQLDASHTREHPGTGLGLAICRELAEMLGATVSFVSSVGEGATFYVDLPIAHLAEEPQPLMV